MGVEPAWRRERWGGRGDGGNDTCDAGGDGGVHGRGIGCEARTHDKYQQLCARCVVVRADLRTCGRVWAGAPWRMPSLLPLRKVLRAHR